MEFKLAKDLVAGDRILWAGEPATIRFAEVFQEHGREKVELLAHGETFTAADVIGAFELVRVA